MKQEQKVLRGWKLRISLLMAVVTPTLAASGAYYSLKSTDADIRLEVQKKDARMHERVSSLELNTQQHFADKQDLREIHDDVKSLRSEVSEIKTILIRRSR